MLRNIRERLTLALILALPFHALLVTFGTKLMLGPGSAPLPLLALWKETLLGVILFIALIECAGNVSRAANRFDVIDFCILALVLLGIIIRPSPQASGWAAFAYGFKYDLLPLVAFLMLRRVEWSKKFLLTTHCSLLMTGVVIALYGIVTLYLPDDWFRFLGYSDLHSLYSPDSPIAAFQQIGGSAIQRIQSVMSGPNQLGLWLLLPWTMSLNTFLSRMRPHSHPAKERGLFYSLLIFLLLDIALFFTYSRAAWIAAVVIGLVLVAQQWPSAWRKFVPGVLAVVVLLLLWKPNVLLRFASSRDHLLRPIAAMGTILDHPLGLGLGSAGPASNRFSETCVFLEAGSNADWARSHPDLCIFVGGSQVQPLDHPCACPVIPENWYLQIGIELGIAGLLIYVMLVAILLIRLARCRTDSAQRRMDSAPFTACPSLSTFLWLLGLALAGLFLHSFEDAAVAYTAWILAAMSSTIVRPRS